jgi:hypothetical protein
MAEEEKEDIIKRLEALRRRAPEERPSPPPIPPQQQRRKRLARIVGVAVISLVILSVSYVGYVFLMKPEKEEKPPTKPVLDELKTQVESDIRNAFNGLPAEYTSEMNTLIEKVRLARTKEEITGIDYVGAAERAWRSYLMDRLTLLRKTVEEIELVVGDESYMNLDEITQKIGQLNLQGLRSAVLRGVTVEYVPIRLKREQAVGGMAAPGDLVNIYYKNGSQVVKLARNARVIAVLRGISSGNIQLSESERKLDTGGGIEGFGTGSSLGIGDTSASLAGSYEGSAGLKLRQTETTYTVEIEELQKAAAASKLSRSYIEGALANYGLKLNTIEIETNIGDLDIEYLLLFEVRGTEAPDLVLRSLSDTDRENIFVTIAKTSEWMKDVK